MRKCTEASEHTWGMTEEHLQNSTLGNQKTGPEKSNYQKRIIEGELNTQENNCRELRNHRIFNTHVIILSR